MRYLPNIATTVVLHPVAYHGFGRTHADIAALAMEVQWKSVELYATYKGLFYNRIYGYFQDPYTYNFIPLKAIIHSSVAGQVYVYNVMIFYTYTYSI